MHIIMSCVGSYGDVLPHIAIGETLAARGHEVIFLTSAYFRGQVEAAGLAFDSVLSAEAYVAGVRDPAVWRKWGGLRAGWGHLQPAIEQGYAALARHLRPQSVLTGSSMAFWVRMAQEKFGHRAATIHLAPMFLLSAADPPAGVLPGFAHLPLWVRQGVMGLADWGLSDRIMGPDVNRQRAGLGLPPVKNIGRRWMHAPQRVICAFPDWFCAPAADWPANTVCAGFSRSEAGAPLTDELAAFLAAGPAPVVFTPGSGMGSAKDFFGRALAACAALGRRAVLVTGFRDQLPDGLPDFAFHAGFANFELLAPRAAAFVHAGGIGTTGLLMEAGARQLFCPFAVDQIDISVRALRLGVGLRIKPSASVAVWVAALARLLDDPGVGQACAAVAARGRQGSPGRVMIADMIERLAD